MQTTLSIRIGKEDYNFIKKIASEKKEDVSKAVREFVDLGRLMYAIDNYKKGKASIGKSAEIAGISISEMIEILSEFGVENRIDYDDYAEGLKNLKKAW